MKGSILPFPALSDMEANMLLGACTRVTALACTPRERSGTVLVIKEMKRGVKSTEGDRFLWSHGTCTITA